MKRLAFAACLVLPAPVLAGGAVQRWDMPTAYRSFHNEATEGFASCVREETDGGIVITVRPGGEMLRGPEILRALKEGKAVIGERLLSAHRHDNYVWEFDSVPFLATTYEASERLHGAAEPSLRASLEAEGLHLLYSVPWPPQELTFKREIVDVSDIRGERLRAWGQIPRRLAELSGMGLMGPEIGELSTAFESDYADVFIGTAHVAAERNLHRYLSHHYTISAWFPRNSVMMRREVWDGLGEAERGILTDCALDAAEQGLRLSKETYATSLAALRDAGMRVIEPDEATMAAFREKVGEPMLAEWLERSGGAGARIVEAYRASVP